MNRHQIILLVVGVVAVVVLYRLPRVVVENDKLTEVESPSHSLSLSEEDINQISDLRVQLSESQDPKKSVNFAANLDFNY